VLIDYKLNTSLLLMLAGRCALLLGYRKTTSKL